MLGLVRRCRSVRQREACRHDQAGGLLNHHSIRGPIRGPIRGEAAPGFRDRHLPVTLELIQPVLRCLGPAIEGGRAGTQAEDLIPGQARRHRPVERLQGMEAEAHDVGGEAEFLLGSASWTASNWPTAWRAVGRSPPALGRNSTASSPRC
ncbi:MAG: hypothetical protein ACJ8AI_35375 [Rhodopila sp.]